MLGINPASHIGIPHRLLERIVWERGENSVLVFTLNWDGLPLNVIPNLREHGVQGF